jgi:hypothetical protein
MRLVKFIDVKSAARTRDEFLPEIEAVPQRAQVPAEPDPIGGNRRSRPKGWDLGKAEIIDHEPPQPQVDVPDLKLAIHPASQFRGGQRAKLGLRDELEGGINTQKNNKERNDDDPEEQSHQPAHQGLDHDGS